MKSLGGHRFYACDESRTLCGIPRVICCGSPSQTPRGTVELATRAPTEVIASWLEPRDLVPLALASKAMVESPFCSLSFRHQERVHVPSHRKSYEWLARSDGPPLLQALPVALAIALSDDFPELHNSVLRHVETLAVQVASYSVFDRSLEILRGLDMFPNLTALELSQSCDVGFSVSLRVIAEAAPRLHTLRLHGIDLEIRIDEVVAEMPLPPPSWQPGRRLPSHPGIVWGDTEPLSWVLKGQCREETKRNGNKMSRQFLTDDYDYKKKNAWRQARFHQQ